MLGKTIITRDEIERIVSRVAGEINRDLGEEPAVFIGVLKGCVFFFTDLVRQLKPSIEVDFIQVSSYGASTHSSGTVRLVKDITADVRDRHVFLVEDIVDTGTTLKDVANMIRARHPKSVRIVSLLSKPSRRKVEVDIAFLGAEIEDVFVVGYGLDCGEKFRNLDEIHEFLPDPE